MRLDFLDKKNLSHIIDRGISLQSFEDQLNCFEKGKVFSNIVRPATLNDGITSLSILEAQECKQRFERSKQSLTKFVPASGMATRMFLDLYKFLKTDSGLILDKNQSIVINFFQKFNNLPFAERVIRYAKVNFSNFDMMDVTSKYRVMTQIMLDEDKLNFKALPKALFPFHKYPNFVATAIEDHIFEGLQYTSSSKVDFHFTILEKYIQKFQTFCKSIKSRLNMPERCTISFSYQDHTTDTISLDDSGHLVRSDNDTLYFRTGGHGALISNLQKIDTDIIFIKNIDNIEHRTNMDNTVYYKKVLAGKLLDVSHKVFNFFKKIDYKESFKDAISQAKSLLKLEFKVAIPSEFDSWNTTNQISYLVEKLYRPIRICGMVKNRGNVGGGPFWVKDSQGNISLQIVEKHQINIDKSYFLEISDSSTHFNPVDVVCSIKDYKGEMYDLERYIDKGTYFLSKKSYRGKDINVLELPGLWNGAMAKWNTIFIEVHEDTFAPVKSVHELLHPLHQDKICSKTCTMRQ